MNNNITDCESLFGSAQTTSMQFISQSLGHLLQHKIVKITTQWALNGAKLAAVVGVIYSIKLFINPPPLLRGVPKIHLGISSVVIISALSGYGTLVGGIYGIGKSIFFNKSS